MATIPVRVAAFAAIAAACTVGACDDPARPSEGFLDEVPSWFTLLHRDNVSALLVDTTGHVMNLAMTPELYDYYRTAGWDEDLARELTKRVFHYVYDDVFDFLILSFDPGDPRTDLPTGFNHRVRNPVGGLCWPQWDGAYRFNAPPRLRATVMLWRHESLRNGPSLHEIAHTWGASLLGAREGNHWNLAGVGGQLGGWVTGTLEELEPGLYRGYGPSGAPFHSIANGGNRVPYAPLELYMMGFLPPDSVPDVELAVNGEVVDELDGTFTASAIDTISGRMLTEQCGPRVPSYVDAPHELGVLYVVISAGPLEEAVVGSIVSDVIEFSRAGSDDRSDLLNFWEATGGRARLRFEGLLEALF